MSDTKFNAAKDAERLRSVARGLSYNAVSEAVWKHVILEIAMRLETGAYIELANPDPEPDYWHVVDEYGESIYSASFKQACHDHINDALNNSNAFQDLEAEKWIVEGLFVKTPAQQRWLLTEELQKTAKLFALEAAELRIEREKLYAALKNTLPLLHTGDELPIEYYADKPGVLGDAIRALGKARG